MNRRTFLQILSAAGVAIVAAPQALVARALDPTVPTVGPTILPVTPGLQTVRIGLPDGTVWQMHGYVRSQEIITPCGEITTSTVEFQPSGPCECVEERTPWTDPGVTYNGSPIKPLPARSTTVEIDGVDVGELQEISLPRTYHTRIDVTRDPRFTGLPEEHREYMPGLKRVTPLTFTVNFDGKMHL